MDNDSIMKVLLTYDNLKELQYDNNILTYQGKSISIKDVPLRDFFSNQYSQLYIDQKNISAEDFFNIMDIHPTKIIDNNKNNIDQLEQKAIHYLENN